MPTFVGEPHLPRRTFLAGLAGCGLAAGWGMFGGTGPRATADLAPNLATVAAAHRGQRPTQWGLALPGVATTFAPAGRQVALTLDACDGKCDDALIDTLERNAVPAVLFLSSKWIDANPGRTERLSESPLFEIGNHGTRHVPLSVTGRSAYGIGGTRSADEVATEVWTNHTRIAELTGTPPTWFRPGTAYYDDVGLAITQDLGQRPLGFSVDADNGAKAPAQRVRSAIVNAAPGSILHAHMNHPECGTAAGVGDAIADMRASGWEFVSLANQTVQ